jgi:hypothetical protein
MEVYFRMKKFFMLFLVFFAVSSFAKTGKEIAKGLGLVAADKASRQWERVFKKDRKMKKLGIDKLSDGDKASLKEYLVSHAADSDRPEAAGM